ncbi:hypothetical protein M569_03451, partial [Genlisea aurea]
NLKPAELMGATHLFRQLPSGIAPPVTIANVNARTTLLFVVAVPNYVSSDDFLVFCESYLGSFTDVLFLRNDGMEDRYSVLIKLESQVAADGFYCSYQGKRFKIPEVEVCHLYFVQSVDYTEYADVASEPPPGYTELPSCPVCLERLDPDSSGIQSTFCDHSSHCSCVLKWTYLSCPVCRLCQEKDEKAACAVCGTLKNLWICLICGFVGCGRYEKGHASGHWSYKKHNFSLELEKQEIWDYAGDKYVHRLYQSKSGGKSAATDSHKDCSACMWGEEEGLDSALFNSKIEGILDEYNRLLASQLDIQRQHYKTLLAEAKSGKERSIQNAVEKALFSRAHDLVSDLEALAEEKKAVVIRNEELTKQQEHLRTVLKESEERERSVIKSKEEQISDLREQIRDMKVYVETQRMVMRMSAEDSDGIRGGTVVAV